MKTAKKALLLFISFALLMCILAGGYAGPVFAAETKYTISGRISLPEGDTAGKGGVHLYVEAHPRFLEDGPRPGGENFRVAVTIPEGQTGAGYMLSVTEPPEGFGYTVSYSIDEKAYPQYRFGAFYCQAFPGQSSQFPTATALNVTSHGSYEGIDFGITKYSIISGTIVLPEGKRAPQEGLDIKLIVFSGKESDVNIEKTDDYYSVVCHIPKGENRGKFEFKNIDPNRRFIGWYEEIGDMDAQGYRLMYQLPGVPGYEWYGFYAANGTVQNYSDADKIDVTDSNLTDVEFTLLPEAVITTPDALLGEAVDNLGTAGEINEVTIDILKDLKSSLENAGSPEEALSIAQELISKLPEALKKAGSEFYAEELKKAIALIAQKALERSGVQEISPVNKGDMAEAELFKNNIEGLKALSDDVLKTAASLQKLLKSVNVDEKLKPRVVANITDTGDKKAVTASISQEAAGILSSKGIGTLEISSDIASIALPSNILGAGCGKSLQVGLSRADAGKELNSVQKKAVKNNPVYDISTYIVQSNGAKENLTKFDTPLEIRIPYSISAAEDPADITVFCIDAKGNMENMSGIYNPVTKTVSFTTKHLCLFTVEEYKVDFKDIKESLSYKTVLQQMASQGIVTGTNGRFMPESDITRAQYVQMLVKAFKIGDLFKGTVDCNFTDVKKSSPYYKEIAIGVKAGIVQGGSGNKFSPDSRISRQDLAVITAKTASLCKKLKTPADMKKYLDFTDILKIAQFAKPPVSLVSKYYVMGPKKEKEFMPANAVDRVDAALTIYKLMWVQNPEKNPLSGYRNLIE